ncbi:hypothetical protein D6817_01720 [Candidatus Pacearchaeota archaeon]|nr:MAG: hypothetical protein D6817_01720 [Candidatus Pacearchaeota archaeon]
MAEVRGVQLLGAVIVVLMFASLFASAFAFAAGVSEGANIPAKQASVSERARLVQVFGQCEDKESTKERVLCRLRKFKLAGLRVEGVRAVAVAGVTPEACKRLAERVSGQGRLTRAQCKDFYRKVSPCFEKQGRAKVACFRRISGLGVAAASLKAKGNGKAEAIGKYVVSLLYELEERIEKKVDDGVISEEQAADVVSLIIEIKEKILDGAPRSEVKPMLAELRSKLKELKRSAQNAQV